MSDAIIKPTGLALMREEFPPNQISKLPKGTKAQNECAADQKINCKVCGGWHHSKIIHLDYVGHAALTDRLLDADPAWFWEPLAMSADGLPVMDQFGGMWIKLTVCGVTRLGYGAAVAKNTPDGQSNAVKEVIGDALRNAAMRFGAALDLWHKGDLHADDDDAAEKLPGPPSTKPATAPKGETTPKARAMFLMVGVSRGDAVGAAAAIASWDQALIDEVWKHLDEKSVIALQANWPKEQP